MRNIFALNELMKRQIPNDRKWIGLKNMMDLYTAEFKYKAPEQWFEWYQKISRLFGQELGEPDEPWKKAISDIFCDKQVSL